MKSRVHLTKFSLIVLLIVSALFGAYVGLITYQYETIVKGILGFTVIYLILLDGAASKMDGAIDTLLLHVKFRDFIQVFIWSGLSYWAAGQIWDAVLFLVRR